MDDSALEIAKQAAEVSDRLNNLLTGIVLKAGMLANESEGSHRDGLLNIIDLCITAADHTKALRELAERHYRREV